jgi:hypothetical protein
MGETFGGDPRRAEVPALLAQAIQQHERALELAVTAPDSLIDIQSRLQLGFDYYQQGRYALDEKQFGLAEQALMRARAELETGLNQIPAEQHRLLTQAHLAIATTEYHLALARAGQNDPGGAQSHYRSAIQAYDACIAQAAALPEDSYLGGLRRTCEQVKQIAQQALGN